MTNLWSIISLLLQGVILVFCCLSLGVAFKQARMHLSWLIPLVIGQVLGLIASLSNLLLVSYMTSGHASYNHLNLLVIPQQVVYGFATLAHVWFAVVLFLTLRSQVFAPRPAAPPQAPGSWPPPPGPPSV